MRRRYQLFGIAALAAVALAPGKAKAQSCGPVGYVATLGLGGTLTGCFSATLQQLGENATGIGQQYFWAGNFAGSTLSAPSNAPLLAGTQFTGSPATDDCGTSGGFTPASFAYCTGGSQAPILLIDGSTAPSIGTTSQTIFNAAGEFVIGMFAQDLSLPLANGGNNYWVYSGNPVRNTYPGPVGFQEVMYQLANNGSPIDGEFLFAWEDINSGCLGVSGSGLHPSLTLFNVQDLGNKAIMDDPNNCNVLNPGGQSDNDFNDSYIILNITGTRLDTTVPEPMTMSLMAAGLVSMGGLSLRRRKRAAQ